MGLPFVEEAVIVRAKRKKAGSGSGFGGEWE